MLDNLFDAAAGRQQLTIKGILFDKDGTLLDFHATWGPANRAAALLVAGGDKKLARKLLDVGGEDEASGIVAAGSLLATETAEVIAKVWAELAPAHGFKNLARTIDDVFWREGIASAVPIAGLVQTITALHGRDLILGVATSDSHKGAIATLEPFDILPLLSFVAGYDSGHGGKPGPGMVCGFCDHTGLTPAQTMVVGDSVHDLKMGRAAGAGLCVGVLSGTSDTAELSPFADHVIGSICDIDSLL